MFQQSILIDPINDLMHELKRMIKAVVDKTLSLGSDLKLISWEQLAEYYIDDPNDLDDARSMLLGAERELHLQMLGKLAFATRTYSFQDVLIALHAIIGLARYLFAERLTAVCSAYISALSPILSNPSYDHFKPELAVAIRECNDELHKAIYDTIEALHEEFPLHFSQPLRSAKTARARVLHASTGDVNSETHTAAVASAAYAAVANNVAASDGVNNIIFVDEACYIGGRDGGVDQDRKCRSESEDDADDAATLLDACSLSGSLHCVSEHDVSTKTIVNSY